MNTTIPIRANLISRQTADRRDLQPMHKTRNPENVNLEFHVTVGGPGSVPVMVRVDAWCQRRAEQFALAWAKCRWFRDSRQLRIAAVDLVD